MKFLKKYNENIEFEWDFEEYDYDKKMLLVKYVSSNDYYLIENIDNNYNVVLYDNFIYTYGLKQFEFLLKTEIENVKSYKIYVNNNGKYNIYGNGKQHQMIKVPYTVLDKEFNIVFTLMDFLSK